MAFDDNPDEIFDDEEAGGEAVAGNGDEGSNRSFRMMMIGLGAVGVLGVLLIGAIFMSRQGERNQVAAQNEAVQQTNAAIAQLSQITPTPAPTLTPIPTNTAAPTNTSTPVPSPTPGDISSVLAGKNFKTITTLLAQSGLLDTLKSGGPFTLLAPSDEAFAQLPPASLEELSKDPQKLAALLKYHVIEGKVSLAEAAKLTETKTLEGQPVTIVLVNGKPTLNDALITTPNIEIMNGIVHEINRVLAPPDVAEIVALVPTPAAPAASTQPEATTVAGAATQAPGSKTTPAVKPGETTVAKAGTSTVVPTRVPPLTATAQAAASKPVTGTGTTTGAQTPGKMPQTGAGEDLLLLVLAAFGLVGVLVVARRLRTASN